MTENAQLRKLLKVEEGIDRTEIADSLKHIEDKVNEVIIDRDDWKMPEDIRKILETKKRVKETERQVSLQMRKLAEQEILKEAEKLSKRSR